MFDNLTVKEKYILHLMAVDKLTVKEISDKVLISTRTVHYHLQNIYKKRGYPTSARSQMKVALEYVEYINSGIAEN